MSFAKGVDPEPGNARQCDAIERVVVPRSIDAGGFIIRRALPANEPRMVGPFIFFDHFGPAIFKSGEAVDVRPHPHIGLATLTYLFDGEIIHRDNLGTLAPIRPGEVNWMTAGRGIAHSERTAPERRLGGEPIHGLQCWVALPAAREEMEPAFAHHAAHELPSFTADGVSVNVAVGSLYGARSPVRTETDTLFAVASLKPGALLPVDADHEERAVYVVDGEIDLEGDHFGADRLLVIRPGDRLTLKAVTDTRLVILGGAAMDGPRHLWWNFVSSRTERIESAKADWKAGRFALVPGDEAEFIPLPSH